MDTNILKLHTRIRMLLYFFMAGLVLSGLTVFPLEMELYFLKTVLGHLVQSDNPLYLWIDKVHTGLKDVNSQYPFLAYGTDWLAFAHIIIAIAFVGPLRDPVRNIWVIHFGMIACVAIFPLAFIAGEIRGIPLYWRILDCMFGAIGIIPLMYCDKYIRRICTIEKFNLCNQSE
jgi:hypothetical protein